MKKSFRVTTVFTGASACAAAFAPAATAAPATPGTMMATATPGHVTTPGIKSGGHSPCVAQSFGTWDSGTYLECVADMQVLLNDLYYIGDRPPYSLLATDGHFGPLTAGQVEAFNYAEELYANGSVAKPTTWQDLCITDSRAGFHGAYWHNAGCSEVA